MSMACENVVSSFRPAKKLRIARRRRPEMKRSQRVDEKEMFGKENVGPEVETASMVWLTTTGSVESRVV